MESIRESQGHRERHQTEREEGTAERETDRLGEAPGTIGGIWKKHIFLWIDSLAVLGVDRLVCLPVPLLPEHGADGFEKASQSKSHLQPLHPRLVSLLSQGCYVTGCALRQAPGGGLQGPELPVLLAQSVSPGVHPGLPGERGTNPS